MKSAKILIHSIVFLLAINFSISLPLAVSMHYIFNEGYYKKELSKLGIYSKFPEADIMIKETISYLKGEKESISFLNENENAHMNDVKILIGKSRAIFYFSVFLWFILVFLLFLLLEWRDFLHYLRKSIILGGNIIIIIFAILFILSAKFGFLFAGFHLLFFEGNWIFPAESTIVNLFPFEFFYNTAYRIATVSLIIASAMIVFIFIIFFINKKCQTQYL